MVATDSGLGLVWDASSSVAPQLHFLTTDFFSPVIHDARNNNATVLSLIPQSSQFVSGKFVIEPVEFGRNHKQFNAIGEDGYFSDPGTDKARIYAYRTRFQQARFIIQGSIVRRGSSDATSYIDPIMRMTRRFTEDYLVDKARQMYSDGSGRICEVGVNGSYDADTTMTMNLQINQSIGTGMGSPGASVTGAVDQPPTMYLEPDMRVMFVESNGTVKAIATVTSVDSSSTATFELVRNIVDTATATWAATTVTTGTWIVKCSNSGADITSGGNALARARSAFKKEPMGLNGILGYGGVLDGHGPAAEVAAAIGSGPESASTNAYTWSGTEDETSTNAHFFQGLPTSSSAGAAFWDAGLTFNQGVVLHNSGTRRTPNEELFMRALSTLRERNNAKVKLWLSNYGVRDTYAASLLGDKRYIDTLDLKGGWDPALVGPAGIPWVVDRLCWHNCAYGMALEDGGFMQHIVEPLSWASEQGSPIWMRLPDQDKYQAALVEDYGIGVGVRNRAGMRIMDLLEA